MDLKIEPELERCLPPLPDIQYQKLKASIEKKYDPAKPIVLWLERPRTIVDGHHRYRACQETGQEPTTVEESFASLEDAVLYALQRQIEQRNLSAGQLVMIQQQMMTIEEEKRLKIEAKAAQFKGDNQYTADKSLSAPGADTHNSREVAKKIAEKAHVPVREVYRINRLKEKAAPELLNLVQSGEVSSRYAERFSDAIESKEEQKEVICSGGKAAVNGVASTQRKVENLERKTRKDAEEAEKFAEFRKELAEKTTAAHIKNDQIRSLTSQACLLPNTVEQWCEDCQWGFDVYLPHPGGVHCPYCLGDKIVKRDAEWNPREVI